MKTSERANLLRLLADLSDEAPELRFGQLVANLATSARGPDVESIWDAEDPELAAAAERLLGHYRGRNAGAA